MFDRFKVVTITLISKLTKFKVNIYTVIPAHGGGRGVGMGVQKCQKSRFFTSVHTLTTVQPREKVQLTKFVRPQKWFGSHLQTL